MRLRARAPFIHSQNQDQLRRRMRSVFTKIKVLGKLVNNAASRSRHYGNRNLLPLAERGLISAFFPTEEKKKFVDSLNSKPLVVYAGFDPTADSLHVGNLAVITMLLHCQRGGHHVIALLGGATGRIGDPSGKKSERPALDWTLVKGNLDKLRVNLQQVFDNHEKVFWDDKGGKESLAKVMILDNYDWYKNLNVLDFVGKIGRHFRLGNMLLKDSVKSRLDAEEGISFTEFTYQIFQAYDWSYLHKHYDCSVQIGGHDQMGNIYAGHELISRTVGKPVYGITVPLITDMETGAKYGKSAGNAVWLDKEKTSIFDFYQFFVRTKDADVEKLMKLFTFKRDDEIEAIMKKHKSQPEHRLAQQELAKDVTLLVHGEEGLATALKATQALYSDNLEALSTLQVEELEGIFKGAGGNAFLSELYLMPGTTILDMALKARCFGDERDARRIISAGGFSLNYRKVKNVEEVVVPGVHILPNKISLVRVGKKNYYVIKWLP